MPAETAAAAAAAQFTIRLHADDDVVIARGQLVSGTLLPGEQVRVAGLQIPERPRPLSSRMVKYRCRCGGLTYGPPEKTPERACLNCRPRTWRREDG